MEDVNNQYTGEVLQILYNQSRNNEYTDFVIRAGNKRVHCHRAVISTKSEYFDALCKSGQQEVVLDYADEEQGQFLEAIVRFMYLGCIDIKSYNVESLVHAAHLIKHPDLKQLCEDFMVGNLGLENFVSYQSLAKKFALSTLSNACVTFTKEKGTDVLKTDWILSLSLPELREYLQSDDLNVATEDNVILALQRWLRSTKAPSAVKEGYIDSLLQAVRLNHCNRTLLEELTKDDATLDYLKIKIFEYLQHGHHGDHTARPSYSTTGKPHMEPASTTSKPASATAPMLSRLSKVLKSLPSTASASPVPASSATQEPEQQEQVLLVGGFTTNDEVHRNIVFVDPGPDPVLTQSPFSAHNGSYSACTTDDGLIVSGGYDRATNQSMSQVKIFSLTNRTWSDLPDLSEPSNGHGTVSAGSRYFTVGGGYMENLVIERRYADVQVLDLNTLEWSTFSSLPVAVNSPGVAHVRHSLLVLGGHPGDDADWSMDTYSYNIKTGERKTCHQIPLSRGIFHTTAVVEDSVFVLSFDTFLQYVVEHDTWVKLAGPPKPSHLPAMVLHENRLLVLGGYGSDRNRTRSRIQTYDPAIKKWRVEKRTMPVALCSHWALVVKPSTSK